MARTETTATTTAPKADEPKVDKDDRVTLFHPKTKGTTKVFPRSVKVWERSGWQVKK